MNGLTSTKRRSRNFFDISTHKVHSNLNIKKVRGRYLSKDCVPEGKNPATAERKVFSTVFEGKLFKNVFAGNSL